MQTRPFLSSAPTGIEMNGGCAAMPMWIDCPLAVPLPGRAAGQITGLYGLLHGTAWDIMGQKAESSKNPRKPGSWRGLRLERSLPVLAFHKNESKTTGLWSVMVNKTIMVVFM